MMHDAGYIRRTILYGLLCSVVSVPALSLWGLLLPAGAGVAAVLWLYLAGYALLLAAWGRRPFREVVFPLLTIAVTLPLGYYISQCLAVAVAICVFAWIRSGICMTQTLVKGTFKEGTIGSAGAAVLCYIDPHSPFGTALGIWLFFLVQALYFVFSSKGGAPAGSNLAADVFESARQEAEAIVENAGL